MVFWASFEGLRLECEVGTEAVAVVVVVAVVEKGDVCPRERLKPK